MKPIAPIPFTIKISRLLRRDHILEYELESGVARADGLARVVIRSDRYNNPQIVERRGKGGIELNKPAMDHLNLLCFRLIAEQMRHRVGDSGWMVINDVSPYVRDRLEPVLAESILGVLAIHVKAGVSVMSMCVIDGDDPF